jgi:hypothetical protein
MNTPISPNTQDPHMPIIKRPHGRRLSDFGELTEAEKILLVCCATGQEAKIGEAVPTDDADPNTIVRAGFLRFLLLGGDEDAPVHERGVQLSGAWVQGDLDLENCVVPHSVTLCKCKFNGVFSLIYAHITGPLELNGSYLLKGLSADGARCDSGVFLRDGFHSCSVVRFMKAHIGADLDCSGGQFKPREGDAFSAEGAVVKGAVYLQKPFKATGEVRLLSAQIDGQLVCAGGQFEPKEGDALTADGIVVKDCVYLNEEFKATGGVSLLVAQIGGSLVCSGGQFEPKEGNALTADGIVVKDVVYLDKEFKATGEVTLVGAQIGGNLVCSGGQFEPKEGDALSADGAVVKGSVRLGNSGNKRFKATGGVRLLGAQIGGQLVCAGGQFQPKEGDALTADGIVLKGAVYLNEEFKATGAVKLLGAQIGGQLVCNGGRFEPKEGLAFDADGAVVKGDVYLAQGFKATGGVRLLGAQIGGQLDCSGGQFEPKEGDALRADRADIKESVFLRSQFKATGSVRLLGAVVGGDLSCSGTDRIVGVLDLGGATIKGKLLVRGVGSPVRIKADGSAIGHIEADGSSWAKGSILNGLVYKSLGGDAFTNAAARIGWLKLQRDQDLGEDEAKRSFRPQPWKQLQKVLREMGHDADAREVGVAYEDQLRKADRIGQITDVKDVNRWRPFLHRKSLRVLHWLFGFLAGYGYHPLRLFMSLVGVWLFCGVMYWWLAFSPHNAIGPTDPLVFQNDTYAACTPKENGTWVLCAQLPAEYTAFSSLAYSLDILLPLVDLGQEKRWGPLVPAPTSEFFCELLSFSPQHWVRLFNWFQILYGWVASLLFVAIVSGMARRSEVEK